MSKKKKDGYSFLDNVVEAFAAPIIAIGTFIYLAIWYYNFVIAIAITAIFAYKIYKEIKENKEEERRKKYELEHPAPVLPLSNANDSIYETHPLSYWNGHIFRCDPYDEKELGGFFHDLRADLETRLSTTSWILRKDERDFYYGVVYYHVYNRDLKITAEIRKRVKDEIVNVFTTKPVAGTLIFTSDSRYSVNAQNWNDVVPALKKLEAKYIEDNTSKTFTVHI